MVKWTNHHYVYNCVPQIGRGGRGAFPTKFEGTSFVAKFPARIWQFSHPTCRSGVCDDSFRYPASGRINAEFLAIGRGRCTCPVGTVPHKRCSKCPGALRLPRGLKSRSSAVAGLYTFVRVLVGASKGACLIRNPHKSTLRRGKAPHMTNI